MSLKIVNQKTRILTVPSAIHLLHMKAFDYWKSTYLMVIDIVSLLGVLLCPTHLVWILEKNIKNWLDESQKANRLITLVSLLFISWQEITDFEKLNPFITDEYPYMIHQNVWNDAPYNICCYFYEFFVLFPPIGIFYWKKQLFSLRSIYMEIA